jgi:diguanylate cyclase (GGDEF)-like protein
MSATERAYSIARMTAWGLMLVIAIGGFYWPPLADMRLYLAGFGLYTISTAAYFYARRVARVDLARVLIWMLPFDLVALGLLVIALQQWEDVVYPLLMALPIFYAFLLHRRDAWVVAPATALTYLLAHNVAVGGAGLVPLLFSLGKAAAIVFVGVTATAWAVRYKEREQEIAKGREEKARLSDQLGQRLSELQAVSQITEVVHSSLDFDRIGPLVLDIVSKVINITECCMFVIDRSKGETLFSASVGMAASSIPLATDAYAVAEGDAMGDSHFACLSVLDHHSMMVVFCADQTEVEELRPDDRLVLQAVASELVVAIENSQLYKLTKRLAITDELTGLYNYRYLQQRLDEEIERARRYHKDLSLLMIDADDFKLFNDTHGHPAGDVALADLAHVLQRSVREVDVVTRYGGEEFSVILPETDAAGAFVVAEKVREAVSRYEFADADGERTAHFTVSLGLATYPAHAQDKEAILRLSDDALYRAKNGGKNRVRSPVPKRPTRVQPAAEADEKETIS